MPRIDFVTTITNRKPYGGREEPLSEVTMWWSGKNRPGTSMYEVRNCLGEMPENFQRVARRLSRDTGVVITALESRESGIIMIWLEAGSTRRQRIYFLQKIADWLANQHPQ